jgi:hypothetical protein
MNEGRKEYLRKKKKTGDWTEEKGRSSRNFTCNSQTRHILYIPA